MGKRAVAVSRKLSRQQSTEEKKDSNQNAVQDAQLSIFVVAAVLQMQSHYLLTEELLNKLQHRRPVVIGVLIVAMSGGSTPSPHSLSLSQV